jgi:sugar lactone lactonase YvrE
MPPEVTLETTLVADGFKFGEGPRWHDGRLWFTDGPSGDVLALADDGTLESVYRTEHPSGLGWLPDGTLVVCPLHAARVELVSADGSTIRHELGHLAWSTNDMVVGEEGRIFVDLYTLIDDGIAGAIGLVSRAGEARVVADGIQTPNGLAIAPDGTTLVVSETRGSRILAFTIDVDGDLTDQRVYAELGDGRHPDGLCLDAEGGAWVGCYDTGEFLRVLEGGEVTHRIEVDAGWAVATALGGEDRRTLYLIINETTHEDFVRGASAGRIEAVRVEVPGVGWP